MIVLAVFSLAAGFGLHMVHSKAEAARAREHSLDGAIAKINSERQGDEALMAQPRNAQFMKEVDELNTLFSEKAFSWTMAMESLETELPGSVQVTQIEPQRSKEGLITLHLRVVGPHNLADDLVKNLEHSRRFQLPRIVGEEAEAANTPNMRNIEPVSTSNRFNFDLQAAYVPPTTDELAAARRRQKTAEPEMRNEKAAPHPSFPVQVAPHPPELRRAAPLRQAPGRGPYPGVGAPLPVPPKTPPQRTPYTGGPQ